MRKGRMTKAQAIEEDVAALNALEVHDVEAAHIRVDEIMMSWVPDRVREAVEAVKERASGWYMS